MTETGPRQILRPQIRFLWQTKEITDKALETFSAEFGVEFTYGLDGVILKQSRQHAPGWWRLKADGTYCTLFFTTPEALSAGLGEIARRLRRDEGVLQMDLCDVARDPATEN